MEPTFAGELGLLSLFDLGQLLQMNGASGCMTILSEGRRGALFFEHGRIVNAVDETRLEGEEAAYKLFTWKSGHFEFRPDAPTGNTLIDVPTEALMLESARRMDEAEGVEGEAGAAERLLEHQQAFGELRDAFQNLAQEAQLAGAASGAASAELGALRRADDLLLLRPGRPARLRLHGAWRVAREAALDPAEYAQIRTRLLGENPPAEPAWSEVELAPGRRVHASRMGQGAHETLWVRPAALPAPAAAHLIAPPDQMALLLAAERGLVLVGSTDSDIAGRVLHALVASRLTQLPETLLLAADRSVYQHRDGAGVLVEATPRELGGALELAAPGTLALDIGALPAGSLARRLGPVSFILARVACDGGPTMLDQWRQSLDPTDRTSLDGWLQSQPVVLVAAHRPGPDESTLPFNAWTNGSSVPNRQGARA